SAMSPPTRWWCYAVEPGGRSELRIADCGLRIADCGLRIYCGSRIAECGFIVDCGLRINDFTIRNPNSEIDNKSALRNPRSAIRAASVAALALLALACGGRPSSATASALDAAAESYVRLVLALGERDAGSLDAYHGPPEWRADARQADATLPEVRAAAV